MSQPLQTFSYREMAWTVCESPIGQLTVVGGPDGVRSLFYPGRVPALDPSARRKMPKLAKQLEEYFSGQRQCFEVELDLAGAPLQKAVWSRLMEVPYGGTTTYTELADAVDEAARPEELVRYQCVGVAAAAVGCTPVPILIPCHRVLSFDGSLTGYIGGMQRKQTLLDLERRIAAGESIPPALAERQLATH
jgi:methylated-DNA-[protein]-cysteine S-methyltransferase